MSCSNYKELLPKLVQAFVYSKFRNAFAVLEAMVVQHESNSSKPKEKGITI